MQQPLTLKILRDSIACKPLTNAERQSAVDFLDGFIAAKGEPVNAAHVANESLQMRSDAWGAVVGVLRGAGFLMADDSKFDALMAVNAIRELSNRRAIEVTPRPMPIPVDWRGAISNAEKCLDLVATSYQRSVLAGILPAILGAMHDHCEASENALRAEA